MTETPGIEHVAEALRRGVRVVWDPPRYRGPASALALAKEVPDTAREVLRRAALFREQIQHASVCPFLTLPGAETDADGCLSCGLPITTGFRCRLCQFAAHLALDLVPADGAL